MLTMSNYKSIEFLRNLFSKAIQEWENSKDFYFSEHFDLKYYKVAIEYANHFRDLGFFQEVDDVIDYLEKPHKFQDELYLIKLFDLSTVYKQDYTEWLKDIECPKEMEIDVVDVIEHILHNNYSIHFINEILDELEQDFKD